MEVCAKNWLRFMMFAEDNYDELVKSPKNVTPVETGVQNLLKRLDSGFRRNDEKRTKRTFYETIKCDGLVKSLQSGRCERSEAISYFVSA